MELEKDKSEECVTQEVIYFNRDAAKAVFDELRDSVGILDNFDSGDPK